MQFFPASTPAANSAVSAAVSVADLFTAQTFGGVSSDTQYASFDSVLGSFIEEGRNVYSGRPAGFSGYEKERGTLGQTQTDAIVESLRKRNVDADAINGLEQLLASGAPMTVGRVISTLSGESRKSPPLEGEERDAFGVALGKLGFDKNETEEMLGYSDAGNTKAMSKKLTEKLAALDDSVDLSRKEFSSLLKGLDVSEATQKTLQKLFGQGDERTLSGAQLQNLLAHVSKEYAQRAKNADYTRTQVRAALDEALKAAKIKEQSDPVEDLRGSRRSDQSEALMQNSLLKKTGATNIKKDMDEEAAAHNRRQGRQSLDRTLGLDADGKIRPSKSDDKAGDKIAQLLHRIDLAVPQGRSGQAGSQAQNLNTLARSFRQEIFSQVESGILQNAQNGARQLALQLNPGELGQLTVLLSVRQGEVSATIRTENQDTASVIREQLAELKATLEAQGLKVKDLDVQTQLRDNAFSGQWNSHQDHNLMRDSAERDRLLRLTRLQRGSGDQAGGAETLEAHTYATESTGLHIVA